MQQINMSLGKSFSAIIFLFCFVISCSNKSNMNAQAGTADASAATTSGDTTYLGKYSLAYSINGQHVAIKDFMHDGDGKNWMALFINKVTNTNGMLRINVTNEITKEVFNFSVANTGSSNIHRYRPSLADFAGKPGNEATYMSPKYKNYYGDSVLVTINSVDGTHVTGTFAGKFLSDDDKPVPLEITSGSFDVPFTKDTDN